MRLPAPPHRPRRRERHASSPRQQRPRPSRPPPSRAPQREPPPCASATERTIERPRPAPPPSRGGRRARRARAAARRVAGSSARPAVDDPQHAPSVGLARVRPRRGRPARCGGRRSRPGCRPGARAAGRRRARARARGRQRSAHARRLAPPRGRARDRREVDRLAAASGRLARASTHQPSSSASVRSAASITPSPISRSSPAAGVGVGERDVGLRADDGQRAAQLVAGVGHEAPLGGERARHRARARRPGEQPSRAPPATQRGARQRDSTGGASCVERGRGAPACGSVRRRWRPMSQ